MKKKNLLSLVRIEREAKRAGVRIVELQTKKGNSGRIEAAKLGIGDFEIVFGKNRRGIRKLSTEITERELRRLTELNVPPALFDTAHRIASKLFMVC